MDVIKKAKSREKRKAERRIQKEKAKAIRMEKDILKMRNAEKKKEHFKSGDIDNLENKKSTKISNGRSYTVSVAVPGSILDNAQSPELRTYLAGQIARACVIFQVDEIVVYDESAGSTTKSTDGEFAGIGKKGNCNVQLARILQYLECPQYLRKKFFPKHPDLQFAGILNPLDCPHHMRIDDFMPFREGVVLDRPIKDGHGSFVDCGARNSIQIDKKLHPNVRVTVRMFKGQSKKHEQGCVVSPDTPRTEQGLYWGYSVRLASSFSKALVECPYTDTGKYDLTLGTSERGESIDDFSFPSFKHVLVVFGGLQGLEAGLDSDETLVGIDDPSTVFDKYLNACPGQGSRTIRTEEAIVITMSALRPKLDKLL